VEPLQTLYEAADDPLAYARRWKQNKRGKVIGYPCAYTPEEILYAGGMLPFRIFSANAGSMRADTHLPPYCCSRIKGILEDGLSGRLSFLDGAVFPHTCDAMQRLSDIWRLNLDLDYHADILVPGKLGTPSAVKYMLEVFRGFRHEIEEKMGVQISPGRLTAALGTYSRLKGFVRRVYDLRLKTPGRISRGDIQVVTRAAVIMDRDDFVEIMPAVIEQLNSRGMTGSGRKKRLILSGGLCDGCDLAVAIENAGGMVVGDDFCTGARYFDSEFTAAEDPLEAIAAAYLERVICPSKHSDLSARGRHLLRLVRSGEAEGVIFVRPRYCDPHAFDYPHLKTLLEKEGVPSMLLEIDGFRIDSEQVRTRCEIFFNTL